MSHDSKTSSNFVLIAQPRTGSNFLASLLHSHPLIRVLIEPINPSGHTYFMQPSQKDREILPDKLVHTNISQALEIIFKPVLPNLLKVSKIATAPGFKIMIHQIQALQSEEKFWYHAFRDMRIILLYRRNILRQVLSEEIVKKEERTTYWGETPPATRVVLDLDHLEKRIEMIEAERRYVNSRLFGRVVKQIWYEDIKNNLSEVDSVVTFLGCDPAPLETNLQEQNTGRLEDTIINYQQVAQAMKTLKLEHFLES